MGNDSNNSNSNNNNNSTSKSPQPRKNNDKKKSKKNKRVQLIKNPFSDTETTASGLEDDKNANGAGSSFSNGLISSLPPPPSLPSLPGSASHIAPVKNPFSDSRACLEFDTAIAKTKEHDQDADDDDESDDEENEEGRQRRVQARREALAALDPKNKATKNAEFRSLKVTAPKNIVAQTSDDGQKGLQEGSSSRGVEVASDAAEVICTPPTSIRPDQNGPGQDREGLEGQSALESQQPQQSTKTVVPLIEILSATPSPPHSKSRHHQRGSSIASLGSSQNPALLSTALKSSPMSAAAIGSILQESTDAFPPLESTRATNITNSTAATTKDPSASNGFKSLFQRVTDPMTSGNTDVEDHIGIEIDAYTAFASSSASSRRGTFGEPTQQANRPPRFQQIKPPTFAAKKPRQKRQTSSLDPWDSCDDMMGLATDEEDGGENGLLFGGEKDYLKGQVGGGRRRSDDQGLDADISSGRGGSGMEVEDWIVHPRTAAIRGTYSRVRDSIPSPNKTARPMSSSSLEYTTISLASPPAPSTSGLSLEGGASLSRSGSLDSSFYRLKRGASLLMSFGTSLTSSFQEDGRGQEKKNQDLDEDEKVRRMMNGQDSSVFDPFSDPMDHGQFVLGASSPPTAAAGARASSMTFGSSRKNGHHSPNSTPPPPPLTSFSSFPSFHALISSSSLSRAGNSSNTSPPPFSPNAYLRRAQTMPFAGAHSAGHSSSATTGSRMSFSPVSKRKTPAMIPTIVIPQNLPEERSAQSATTVSYTPTSAASSATVCSVFDDDDDDADGKGILFPMRAQQPLQQQEGLLQVPGTGALKHQQQPRGGPLPPMSNAAAAMAAAQRARTEGLVPKGIAPGPGQHPQRPHPSSAILLDFTSDDYIGQFERDRAQSRRGSASFSSNSTLSPSLATSSSSLATAICSAFMSSSSLTGHGEKSGRQPSPLSQEGTEELTIQEGGGGGHDRTLTNQSDLDEKLMSLPEPSPFEGMCSCRGIVNISSMILILCGLVLLILGYPIATSMKRDRLEAEAEAAALAKGSFPSTASEPTGSVEVMSSILNNNKDAATVSPPSPVVELMKVEDHRPMMIPLTGLKSPSETLFKLSSGSLVQLGKAPLLSSSLSSGSNTNSEERAPILVSFPGVAV